MKCLEENKKRIVEIEKAQKRHKIESKAWKTLQAEKLKLLELLERMKYLQIGKKNSG